VLRFEHVSVVLIRITVVHLVTLRITDHVTLSEAGNKLHVSPVFYLPSYLSLESSFVWIFAPSRSSAAIVTSRG
jgi:hypothetical protein